MSVNNYDDFIPPGVCGTLYRYVTDTDNVTDFSFYTYHHLTSEFYKKEDTIKPKWFVNVENFLKATNDETRLHTANEFAKEALYIPDMKDSAYFRNAVMTKELTGNLNYQKSRDHAAHTLYNYILGWYFFDNSEGIRNKIIEAMEKRNLKVTHNIREIQLKNEETSAAINFGDIWPFVSLFHDIGYLFEGAMSTLSVDVQIKDIDKEIRIIHDYFNHRFWKDIDLDFKSARELVRKLDIYVPDFSKVASLASLADYLCVIGDCEPIREELIKSEILKNKLDDSFKKEYGLDLDSFVLWEKHYLHYNKIGTAELIKIMSRIYKNLIWKGLGTTGRRMLDHGVVSGLITLMYSSFFYQIYFGMNRVKDINKDFEDIVKLGLRNLIYLIEKLDLLIKKMKNCSIISDYEADLHLSELRQLSNIHDFIKLFEYIKKEYDDFVTRGNFEKLREFILISGDSSCVPKHFNDRGKKGKYLGKGRKGYKADWWWQKILWGTAASALHNIIQEKEYWNDYKNDKYLVEYFSKYYKDTKRLPLLDDNSNPIAIDNNTLSKETIISKIQQSKEIKGLLDINDDPVAYLGILVDIIQEWDRYSVNKESVYSGELPVQGIDVNMCKYENKIKIEYPTKIKADKVKKALDFSLNGWDAYLEIGDLETNQLLETDSYFGFIFFIGNIFEDHTKFFLPKL